MQDSTAICQPDHADVSTFSAILEHPYEYDEVSSQRRTWRPSPSETVAHTVSRHSAPRAWRRALERSIAADLFPGASATTVTVYEDLAARMDYSTGHVRYCLSDVVTRTGLSRSAVTKHIALLRAAGWLAWAEHGSLRNALRALGRAGYARTATVYAAVIPPAFDRWQGNVLDTAGYSGRVVGITDEARERITVKPVDNSPVDNVADQGPWTPSPRVVKEVGQFQVDGGKDTSTAQARSDKSARPRKTLTIGGYKITADRIETARRLAVDLRPLVNWAQGASYDQLSWVLLDMVGRGWSEPKILLWLRQVGEELGLGRGRRPRWPHRLIAAALLRHDRAEQARRDEQGDDIDRARRAAVAPNDAWAQATAGLRERHGVGDQEQFPTVDQAPEETWDLAELRTAAAADPALVLSFAELAGRDEALRVYGTAAADVLDRHAAGLAGAW